jgi:uncharacterized membrane protein YgdD (TMEM256/DUF423 family)
MVSAVGVSTPVLSLGSLLKTATIGAMQHRTPLAWAGVLGAAGVALGAFGAHALKDTLQAAGTRDAWETAVRFQLLHAAALLGLAAWLRAAPAPARAIAWAARLWAAGTLLFSGSLYLLALGGPRWLGPVTPLGGLSLIAGWIALAFAALGG